MKTMITMAIAIYLMFSINTLNSFLIIRYSSLFNIS
jgi:hypothetical protein